MAEEGDGAASEASERLPGGARPNDHPLLVLSGDRCGISVDERSRAAVRSGVGVSDPPSTRPLH